MSTPMGERRWPVSLEAKWTRVLSLIDADGDCWEWTGYRDTHGYGGVDHLCRNHGCVNPDHLEPVTHRVNTLRSPTAPSAVHARRTHCFVGHPLDGRRGDGKRYCLTCNRIRAANRYATRRVA